MMSPSIFLKVFAIMFLCNDQCNALERDFAQFASDYFNHKLVRFICYLSCDTREENLHLVKQLSKMNMRVSVKNIDEEDFFSDITLERLLVQRHEHVGVLIDGSCRNTQAVLLSASRSMFFDATHVWVVRDNTVSDPNNETMSDTSDFIDHSFQNLNLSVDADIAVVSPRRDIYKLTDVFNFGKIQGNNLEKNPLGEWRRDAGLIISMVGYKYYHRWDFHNLTLRAVSVLTDGGSNFRPEMLEDVRYTPGVAKMTKISAQLLSTLREQHNFRFNYTIVGRWVGSPEPNSTLAVTNLLFWRQQDISCTSMRIYPKWLEWADPFLPPSTHLETKVYYLIPSKGVGNYENRFLTPLSAGVWWSACFAALLCIVVLAGAAAVEGRPHPGLYAICSVLAAFCQQAYEDGVQILSEATSSQGRRATLLVVGLTSMVLYNYYTSSVVSWLLNAAAPTIAGFDGLIRSDLELVFEDVGYSRQWIDSPGFYYYSGFKNPIEDVLREKKVTKAKRTVALMQTVTDGIELIRSGAYAYHAEPYSASQVISARFNARELCDLGALQVMAPAHVYIMGQKRSPYKKFFSWSLMRLSERGHTQVARRRVGGTVPACSGTVPRALALGQAAPAFALLAQAAIVAVAVLGIEILWHKGEAGRKKLRRRAIIAHITRPGRQLRDIKNP